MYFPLVTCLFHPFTNTPFDQITISSTAEKYQETVR